MTSVFAAWSVVQVMVAEVAVIPVACTAVITGAGAAGVEKVKFADVAGTLAALEERAV